jgi:hypothetical protein
MEHLYTKLDQQRTPLKTRQETIQFLLDYSKSLHITKTDGLTFEGNLN